MWQKHHRISALENTTSRYSPRVQQRAACARRRHIFRDTPLSPNRLVSNLAWEQASCARRLYMGSFTELYIAPGRVSKLSRFNIWFRPSVSILELPINNTLLITTIYYSYFSSVLQCHDCAANDLYYIAQSAISTCQYLLSRSRDYKRSPSPPLCSNEMCEGNKHRWPKKKKQAISCITTFARLCWIRLFAVSDFGITTGRQEEKYPCAFAFNSNETRNGTFASPNYPGLYPRNTECYYFFNGQPNEKVHLHFHFFDVEGVLP